MKILSFNCWGLAGPQKRSALRRVVEVDRPDIMLLQVTLGAGVEVKAKLESWFGGWSFETLDARCRLGGLAIG